MSPAIRESPESHPIGGLVLVTVGADRGARAVVLKRAGPAGRRTSGRRNGLDNGEQEPESQSNLGQHG
jgi:hypothetical protein